MKQKNSTSSPSDKVKASLIISIYKDVSSLALVLESVAQQTEHNFEIILSEDGEDSAMKSFIDHYEFVNPMLHLTQEDEGWNKNKALNKAIKASQGDWLIFIDGDCVLHPRFVEMHLRYSAPHRILAGKRLVLSFELTNKIMSKRAPIPTQGNPISLMRFFHREGCGFPEEGFFVAPHSVFCFVSCFRNMYQLKGCNMSCSKRAMYDINGFDEDYILPAVGEDLDLTWRFEGLGYALFSMRNRAVQYHLFHRLNWSDSSENEIKMLDKQSKKIYRCFNGIKKLTPLK